MFTRAGAIRFWAITMGTRRLVAVFGAALAISLTLPAAGAGSAPFDDPATALRDYVAAEDPAYGYRVDSSSSEDGYTVHLLRMTSQRWRAPGEALPTRWRHWLVVIVPDEVSEDVAALVIAGGSGGRGRPSFDDDEIRFGAQLAVLSETVVAILMQAPYQPIAFPDADAPLAEDALVAYSWDKAIETGDYSWAVHLPMVKAAVRAMDTVQDFVPGVAPAAIERFVVVGRFEARRRRLAHRGRRPAGRGDRPDGDRRPQLLQADGAPSRGLRRLCAGAQRLRRVRAGAAGRYARGRGAQAGGRSVLLSRRPSICRNTSSARAAISSSRRMPPNSTSLTCQARALLRYVPNSDHSLSNTEAALIDAVSGLFGWYLAVVDGEPRPTIAWQRVGEEVVVQASPPPLVARLWQASNPDARDFRLEQHR